MKWKRRLERFYFRSSKRGHAEGGRFHGILFGQKSQGLSSFDGLLVSDSQCREVQLLFSEEGV